ncbi:MAG: hypothetical protein QOD73_913 [Solirubrobacteraceae bacterium]|jgi:hypothetical protein|nr:hypothetical protein [Solirubrobacteraceae bacterium]
MPAREDPAARAGEWLHLANEFAEVRVRRVHTRNGVRLEIVAPKLDRAILLDPVELESLTWQTPETFSSFLTQPFGPEPEVE